MTAKHLSTKFLSKEAADKQRGWLLLDAKDRTVGRLATEIASYIKGKHKPVYSPHTDCGDFVVVINADKVKLTGKKLSQKVYHRHTGYFGGLKTETAKNLMETKPERILQYAVQGMLPKGKLGRALNTKLKIYCGEDHPHSAQKPRLVEQK